MIAQSDLFEIITAADHNWTIEDGWIIAMNPSTLNRIGIMRDRRKPLDEINVRQTLIDALRYNLAEIHRDHPGERDLQQALGRSDIFNKNYQFLKAALADLTATQDR